MSLGNAYETALLLNTYNNSDIATVGDATGIRGSSTAGSLYVALHSSDPGEAGSGNTNEVSYTSYARVAVARSGAGWTVSGNTVSNAAAITFPTCTGGSVTATHFSISAASSGASLVIDYGALTSSLAISNGITPNIPIGDLDVTRD